jgi:sortase A
VSSKYKIVWLVERISLVLGLFLLGAFALAYLHRFLMLRIEMENFEARRRSATTASGSSRIETGVDRLTVRNVSTALWSTPRLKAYDAARSTPLEPLAVLRIPKLNLEAPVLEGTDEFTLNRGVGRITSTSLPGQDGNIGIAGHRDGFFRGLRGVKTGDTIELVRFSQTDVYVVDRIRITRADDLGVLRTRGKPSLTLVTCYPFYFVGPAPRRFIVEASLRE